MGQGPGTTGARGQGPGARDHGNLGLFNCCVSVQFRYSFVTVSLQFGAVCTQTVKKNATAGVENLGKSWKILENLENINANPSGI